MRATVKYFVPLLLCVIYGNAYPINVNITTKIEGDGKPVVIGQTNLPDSASLMITISREGSAYSAQDKTTVVGGKFRGGPFTQKGKPLNPGVYTLQISSPLASLQPKSVKGIIGNDGSKLQGPYIEKSSFGENVIKYVTTFTVGSGGGVSTA